MGSGGKKIFCPYCNQESALKPVKKYDGFTLVGEVMTCGLCGHEFTDEEPEVLSEKVPDWAREKGARRVCYRCLHYVKNPFAQKCGFSGRDVEALDSCPEFSPKPQPIAKPPDKNQGKGPSIF